MNITPETQHKEKALIERQAEINKTRKHIGTIVCHNGHKIWEVNEKTGEVELATFKRRDATINFLTPSITMSSEIDVKEGFFYTSALNKKNALKNWQKGYVGGLPKGIMTLAADHGS